MMEHVCNEQILKISDVNWLNFVYYLRFMRLKPDLTLNRQTFLQSSTAGRGGGDSCVTSLFDDL